MDAYWRAANYLSVGQIYLRDNPLLKEPLQLEHVKPRLLGPLGHHAGAELHLRPPQSGDPAIRPQCDLRHRPRARRAGHRGQHLPGRHLQRALPERGPGRGGDEAAVPAVFLSRRHPQPHGARRRPARSTKGANWAIRSPTPTARLSTIPICWPSASWATARAETGPLATSWHSNKFLNPVSDGAVLPILHLNGYKIAGPTVLARISHEELEELFRGYGYTPYFVEGDEPEPMHQLMAATLDKVLAEIRQIQSEARSTGSRSVRAGR